jgi:hypothetical protein
VVAAPAVKGVAELRGKTVAMPRTGAGETAFLTNALLEGEVDAGFFGAVTLAPDAFSAVTMVKLGQAAAAFVPAGVAIPGGLRQLTALRRVGWPMLVALPGTDKQLAADLAARARGFGGTTLDGMTGAADGDYKDLAGSLGKRSRTPVLPAPRPPHFGIKALLGGRAVALPGTDISGLIVEPSLD